MVDMAQEISFDDTADFLDWWFESRPLKGKALEIFERYYANYRSGFNGYLKRAWAERHLELERELEAIKHKENIRVLDLGCGTGSITLYIAGRLLGKGEVIGVDINEDRLFCAEERKMILEKEIGFKLGCEFIESNVALLNEGRKFDLLYLEETFHHLEPRYDMRKNST